MHHCISYTKNELLLTGHGESYTELILNFDDLISDRNSKLYLSTSYQLPQNNVPGESKEKFRVSQAIDLKVCLRYISQRET